MAESPIGKPCLFIYDYAYRTQPLTQMTLSSRHKVELFHPVGYYDLEGEVDIAGVACVWKPVCKAGQSCKINTCNVFLAIYFIAIVMTYAI